MNAQLSVVMNLNVACEASTFDVVAMALKKFMVELGGQTPLITLDDNGYSVSTQKVMSQEEIAMAASKLDEAKSPKEPRERSAGQLAHDALVKQAWTVLKANGKKVSLKDVQKYLKAHKGEPVHTPASTSEVLNKGVVVETKLADGTSKKSKIVKGKFVGETKSVALVPGKDNAKIAAAISKAREANKKAKK